MRDSRSSSAGVVRVPQSGSRGTRRVRRGSCQAAGMKIPQHHCALMRESLADDWQTAHNTAPKRLLTRPPCRCNVSKHDTSGSQAAWAAGMRVRRGVWWEGGMPGPGQLWAWAGRLALAGRWTGRLWAEVTRRRACGLPRGSIGSSRGSREMKGRSEF